jgi:D-alanyl-D-alanine carboxypeptidase/D-alanyl-D-alanine-endopeptidase (penicillin-binding protein 4)
VKSRLRRNPDRSFRWAAVLSAAVLSAWGLDAGSPPRLVWHVETAAGQPLEARDPDESINPASVVKVATSLWALERLGPDHRFATRFATPGLDPETGVSSGDLWVFGGADPDFQPENAYRVAEALNRAGLRRVRGRLLVDDRFWIGWEGGSERRDADHATRARAMAVRLQEALDPSRWDRRTRTLMEEFRARQGIEGSPPRVVIDGGVGVHASDEPRGTLLIHRSNPLRRVLKRFNAYSNNDIERLGLLLGPPEALAGMLSERWELSRDALRIETLSGLGSNRMTPRQVVRLLHEFSRVSRRLDLRVEDLLPTVGCDPGTLEHFSRFSEEPTGSLVAKTGTLARTDGGIAVLAGIVRTQAGERFFCVAAPNAGGALARARAAEQHWLVERIERDGGGRSGDCGERVGYSDDDIRIERPDAAR